MDADTERTAEALTRSALPPDTVGLLEGLTETRAIRRYHDEPVPAEALRAMLFAATRAPSGSNRQPTRFVVLTDGERAVAARALLGRAARDAWRAKASVDGYDREVATGADTAKARVAATMQTFVDHFDEIPVIVLPCLVRYRDPTPTEGASVYPACQNLLLAARALGYGGVITAFHRLVEDELHELLGIPAEAFIAATIPIGRPVGSHGPVRRRPLRDVVFDDAWAVAAPWAVDPPGTRHSGGPTPRD